MPYTSKIIKAGSLLGDTKTILAHWDISASPAENMACMQRDNLLGKSSRSRVNDVLTIFRQRYLAEASVTSALVALVRGKFPSASLERLLYFHSARSDSLLYDVVLEIIARMYQRGLVDVDVPDFQRSLAKLVADGRTAGSWSEATILRISRSLLSSLRDFGVLAGAVNKRIAPADLSAEAFAYIAFYLKQHQQSGARLVELRDWQLFFLSRDGVERCLFEAHQRGLLQYHVAGSVTRLTFQAETLEDYANVLVKR